MSQELWEELFSLCDYNPPPPYLVNNPDSPFSSPTLFYDKHIDSCLQLKRVVLLSSVADELAASFYRRLKTLEDEGWPFPSIDSDVSDEGYSAFIDKDTRESGLVDIELFDAFYVARRYEYISFRFCHAIASNVALRPDCPTWYPALKFWRSLNYEPDHGCRAIAEDYTLWFRRDFNTGQLSLPKGLIAGLSAEDLATIQEAYRRYPNLVTYQFYSPLEEYHAVLKEMGSAAVKNSKSVVCATYGYPVPDSLFPIPPDSTTMPWLPRRSTRLRQETRNKSNRSGNAAKAQCSFPSVSVKPKAGTKARLEADVFIQHAWARAAIEDTTFIVFHSAEYERIGIRHRETGTLYLSELIDVQRCQEPAYGAAQVGLYMAIIQDVLDRARKCRSVYRSGRKRKGDALQDGIEPVAKKRCTTRATCTKSTTANNEEVLCESDDRLLALLRMQYGAFNSPAPAAFIRTGHVVRAGVPCSRIPPPKQDVMRKSKFQGSEYFKIVLTGGGTGGATGKIHKATIAVKLADGTVRTCDVIAKLTFLAGQRKRLRNEYKVYAHLAKHKVKQVPTIYGLFEDVMDEATLLVMSDVGTNLFDRELDYRDEQVTVSPDEAEAFKRALTEIHDAGVRHYDIRPMNLMIDGNGNATIIDFDMAKIGAGRRSRQREFAHLCCLLSGRYRQPNQIPSDPTTGESQSSSATSS